MSIFAFNRLHVEYCNNLAIISGNFAIGSYIQRDIINKFHLMKEDIYWEYCVMMLRKNSIFLPALDMFLLRLAQAGLISKWQNAVIKKKSGYLD